MVRASILDTRTINYLELIGNGRSYRVPRYQRDYSWLEEEWEDLWNDVIELQPDRSAVHYMGALVVEGSNDRDFLIIDGQQRLATLSLFALAVIARLKDMADAGMDSEANAARAQGLRDRFVGEKDPASLTESSRLYLNATDDAFYQDYLVQLRRPLNPRGLTQSNRLLWKCFCYFKNRLDETEALKIDGRSLASLLSETVARQLVFILITVEDELDAYTLFETLNARGLELTTTDLLKNYLFSRVRVPADLEALQRRWQQLIATVGQERFPRFLRYHLLCQQPKVRSQRLFKLVRDQTRTDADVFALLNQLESRAELFAAVLDSSHGYWIGLPDAKPHIRELDLFGVRQMMPLLFTVWERFSKQNFVRVLKLVSVISFRYTVVSRLNTNPLEPTCHRAAKAVMDGQAQTPRDVFTLLKSLYVDDARMKQDFSLMAVDIGGRWGKLTRYILAGLEGDASGRACDHDTDPFTVEHILPQNPVDAWNESIPSGLWEESIYRLGNLTLLESAANRRLHNAVYTDKLAAYAQSTYVLTRRIPEMAPEHWTQELLDKRQQQLAERATHLWRADFA